jgi:hypothetical protein
VGRGQVLAGRIVVVIDFRYHLVSIVAIFLALGLGIILGSTALSPSVLSGLEHTAKSQAATISKLYAERGQLQNQLAGDAAFAQIAEPELIRGLLTGQHVVLVEAPGAPSTQVSDIISALTKSGAILSGQIQMQAKFFDASASTQQALSQLAQSLAPTGVTLAPGPAQVQASKVLASAILTTNAAGRPAVGQRDATSAAIISGFAAGGFLTRTGHPETRATMAVVVIPGTPPATSDANPESQGLVTLARALGVAGKGAVMAGTSTGSEPGSAIDALRTAGSSAGAASGLSSVDDSDTVFGQIVVIWALAAELHGITGSYGSAPTASAPAPSPAPTPLPTPSATGSSASAHPSPSPTSGSRP